MAIAKLKLERAYAKTPEKLENDSLYPKNKVALLSDLTGMPARRGLEKAIISAGEIVNVVSNQYGHLPNENFFKVAEKKLKDEGIDFLRRSINRENRSFAMDLILNDESYHVEVAGNKNDKIVPMLRFVNSYDGSNKTAGYFGMYREICKNGLHVAQTEIGFSLKHRGEIEALVMPNVNLLVAKFMKNEFFEIKKKFEVLAERPISDKELKDYVKFVCDETHLFQYEMSEKNDDPSLNARIVLEIAEREKKNLQSGANQWIIYNAFNEVLHNRLKKTFSAQKENDVRLFETILASN